jgi:DNA primase
MEKRIIFSIIIMSLLISLASAKIGMMPRAVVLVEDPISALKISTADESVVGIAMLGLQIPPALIEMLVAMCSGWTVAVWPDGDAPGILRGTKLYEQLKFIIPDAFFAIAPGQDPKDLSLSDLRKYLDTIPKKASA